MSQNTPTLQTNRLLLRRFNEQDIEALFLIYRDEDVNTYLPWYPLTSIKEAHLFYQERYRKSYEEAQGYRYAICLKEDNVPIGYVHVSMEDHHDLGYGLRKEFWHRGIMSEACLGVIEQLKKDGLPFITATHDVKNQHSGDVMKKIGMKYQYSYEEQWMPKNFLVTFRIYQLNFKDRDFNYLKYWETSEVHYFEEP